MGTDILYFLVLSSPLSGYFIDIFKFAFLVCFNCIFKCYSFSNEKDEIYTKQICEYINKNSSYIQKKSIDDSKIEPDGCFFSIRHMFFGTIQTQISQKEYMSKKETTVEFYGKLPFKVKNKIVVINDEEQQENNKIRLYLARGGSQPSYRELEIYYNETPYPYQQEIMESIINYWKKSKFNICRAMICGKTNIGKSTIGRFLSTKLGASLCFDIDLFAPGNSVMTLYDDIRPTEEEPLIIQVDEFDKLIENIHFEKKPKKVEWLRNMVYNKSTYNSFMSEYITYLPHIIWLFTSNKPISYFEGLDQSYINDNRIDYKKEIF
jgi:hypothetical protein